MKSIIGIIFCPLMVCALSYDVQFVGLDHSLCLKAVKNGSDLTTLQARPPASINGLRYRIESDIPELIKILHAFAFYDASISYNIQAEGDYAFVTMFIHAGIPYKLATYTIVHDDCNETAEIKGCFINPNQLGLTLGKDPAWSTSIVNAELQLLTELSRCGYPLASIDKRKVEVNVVKKEVEVAVCVQEGPFAKFGPSLLFGLKGIKPHYIERRIAWQEGDVYDSDFITETQKQLLKTNLFSSVYISHANKLDEMGGLPMQIRFTESKHSQFSVGGYWATIEGPGATVAWTNRNIRGMGEELSLDADFSKKYIAGKLTYKKPDFLVLDQSYRFTAQLAHEKVYPFLAFSYRLANIIERKFNAQITASVGLKVEHIQVEQSATNGTYFLSGLPLYIKYDRANSDLDPTQGYTFFYSATPYQSLSYKNEHFIKQRLTSTMYIPLTATRKFILALRAQLGSIAGAKIIDIPLPKLFLGGTEDDLRGYRYMSVSPVKEGTTQPLGGRSAIFTSAELRMRFWNIGIVPFADFGTVTTSVLPTLKTKWYKSVGLGLRYYAFFGPIRLDVGIPLNKRSFDPKFQVYASVGQTF
jgi:translocation and assembly module TamA